jgi:hypothetical protein
VAHSVLEMLSQRIYALALGYEDLNDHDQLRNDPVFAVLSGRAEVERPLAGKSTLNRHTRLGNPGETYGPSSPTPRGPHFEPCKQTGGLENSSGHPLRALLPHPGSRRCGGKPDGR